jgi:predicted nucleotidyltransferase
VVSGSLADVLDAEVTERLRCAAADVFPGAGILAAYVFGSRVSGTPRPDSDLDVGYYLESYRQNGVLALREEMRLAGLLSSAAGFPVDLRNLAGAPLDLRGRVLEDGVRIFSGKASDRVALERDLLGYYHDYKDAYRQMHERRLRALAQRRT